MEDKPDAELIKYRLRSEANISLKKLGKILGKDPSTISMVIHGRRKSAPILKAIFEILDANKEAEPQSADQASKLDEEDAV